MSYEKTSFLELISSRRKTKTYNFMGEDIEIMPLSVAQVRVFQENIKKQEESQLSDNSETGLSSQRDLIRMGVIGARDLTDEELDNMSLIDMTDLANEILKYTGLTESKPGYKLTEEDILHYDLALALGKTLNELYDMPHEELLGWFEYVQRRPIGWQADNRAAVIALSFGGGKNTKPQDLFPSIKAVNDDIHSIKTARQEETNTWGMNFMNMAKLGGPNSPYDSKGNLKDGFTG